MSSPTSSPVDQKEPAYSADEYKCEGCGSTLEYAAGKQALTCIYCGTVTDILRNDERVEEISNAKMIVPMTVERIHMESAAYQYMASGKYTPDNMLEYSTFTKVERMYVPAFLFYGDYQATWTASFGYDRKETYTDWTTDSNGRSRAVTKTRTVTDWRPVNGNDSGSFKVLGYAGALLPNNVQKLIEKTSGRSNATEFDYSFTKGIEIEAFAKPEGEVYSTRGHDQVEKIIEAGVMRHSQGDRQRDWTWTSKLDKKSMTALIPACHLIFEYEGKPYEIWFDGADVSRHVGDTLPEDHDRKKIVKLGFIPMGATIVGSIGAFVIQKGMTSQAFAPIIVTVMATLAYGVWRRQSIFGHSSRLRQALLTQLQLSTVNTALMTEEERNALAQDMVKPKRPWIVGTMVKDKVVLPILSVIAAVAVLTGPIIGVNSKKSLYTPSVLSKNAAQGASSQQAPAQIAQTPSQDTNSDQPASALSALVSSILENAANRDETVMKDAIAKIKQLPAPTQGNKVAARKLNQTGLAQIKGNHLPQAVATLSDAAQTDPSNAEVMNNLAYAQMLSGKYQEAAESLIKTIQLSPERSSAWINLGQVAALQGNQALGTASFVVGYRLSGQPPKTFQYLANLKSNDASPAVREAAQKALEAYPLSDVVQQAQEPAAPKAEETVHRERNSRPSATKPAPANDNISQAVTHMLQEGRVCYQQKNYTCAITNAKNALQLSPRNGQAADLLAKSTKAQNQAISNINIE